MYVRVWLKTISSLWMAFVALYGWSLVWRTWNDDSEPFTGAAIILVTVVATFVACYAVQSLLHTVRAEAGARKRWANAMQRDREKHQSQWDAGAKDSLSASRKKFIDGLGKRSS
jgi:hypothetical protein